MRTKSIAMFAMSGLLTASMAYVAPAMADDFGSGMPMEQMLADNSSGGAAQAPSDDSSQAQSNDQSMDNSKSDSNAGASPSDSSSSNSSSDQGTPDTATGDDDY